MASRYSLTIQINPSFPGHAALVVNEPSRQTYAGFGPQRHRSPWSNGKFDVHALKVGDTPPNDFSSVIDGGEYSTFTVPITEEQAQKALAEIERIQKSGENYNGLKFYNPNVCTTTINRVAEAAGLGRDILPRILPSDNGEYLSNIESTLAANRKAKVAFDGAGFAHRIPEALRDIQRDYAYVGGGYDTPSERIGGFPSGPQNPSSDSSPSHDERDSVRTVPLVDAVPSGQSRPAGGGDPKQQRFLRGRLIDASGAAFDSGSQPVPFVVGKPLSSQSSSGDGKHDPNRPTIDNGSTSLYPDWLPPAASYGLGGNPVPQAPGGPNQPVISDKDMSDWFTRWVKPLVSAQ